MKLGAMPWRADLEEEESMHYGETPPHSTEAKASARVVGGWSALATISTTLFAASGSRSALTQTLATWERRMDPGVSLGGSPNVPAFPITTAPSSSPAPSSFFNPPGRTTV